MTSSQPPSAGYVFAPLPFDPILVAAGIRVGVLSFARRLFGWKRYPGSVEAICRAVIDDCWTGQMQIGAVYLRLLREVDPDGFRSQRRAVADFIERDGNFLELYTPAGRPYQGRASLYYADQGMLWAALFLELL